MTDKVKIKAIIKQYADKGERLLEEAYENGEHASTTGYWDGYGDCANLLLRELDDIQEESKVCMYSTANYTNADRLTLCKDCEELCKYNQKTAAESLGISQEVYDEIVDKCLYGSEVELVDDGDLPKEEPVNETLDTLNLSNVERIGKDWNEEPVSEEMWEASKQYALRQVLASTDAEMSEQDYLGLKLFSGFELAVAHKDGAQWQIEKLMAKAIDIEVKVDAGGYPYIPQMELYNYEKDISFAKEGDKYKVILIKEN